MTVKIRISELFEEMAEERLEERTGRETWAVSEMAGEPEFSAEEIRERVNERLNVIPLERERYMRQKWIRRMVAAAAIAVLGTATVFAAANVDLLKEFFVGDTTMVRDQVLSPGTTVSDGEFKMTLEQVLADEHHAMIVVSTVPLTEEAKTRVKNERGCPDLPKGETFSSIRFEDRDYDQYDMDDALFGWNMSVRPVTGSSVENSGESMSMIDDRSTEDKQYWSIELDGVKNPDGGSILLYANKETNPRLFVEVPLKSSLKTRVVKLSAKGEYQGQEYTLEQLDITALGMTIRMSAPTALREFPEGEFFFRMTDGTIKTRNQISDLASWSGHQEWNDENGDDTKGTVVIQEGRFWEAMNPQEFQSVIVDGTEYSLENPEKTKKVEIDPKQRQFEFKPMVKGELVTCPVRELCGELGAKLTWDNKAKRAVIEYRDVTLELTVGSSVILRNGQEIDLYQPVEIYQGKLVHGGDLETNGFNVGIERTNVESDDPHDWTWIVTP